MDLVASSPHAHYIFEKIRDSSAPVDRATSAPVVGSALTLAVGK